MERPAGLSGPRLTSTANLARISQTTDNEVHFVDRHGLREWRENVGGTVSGSRRSSLRSQISLRVG